MSKKSDIVEGGDVVYDPFTSNFVLNHYDKPEMIKKLIEMCDSLSAEYFGPYPIDRGGEDSISGVQTRRVNLFEMQEKYPVINEFKKLCVEITEKYFDANSIFNKPKKVYFDGWFNKLDGEGTHQAHTHGDSDVVLNFYLTTPKGYDKSGNECKSRIVFIAPNHLVTQLTFNENRMECTVNPKPGVMLASPPYYFHYVPQTHSKEWRRSLSVNVTVQKDSIFDTIESTI